MRSANSWWLWSLGTSNCAPAPPKASPPAASRHPGAHGTQQFRPGQSWSNGRSHTRLGALSRLLSDSGRCARRTPSFLTRLSCVVHGRFRDLIKEVWLNFPCKQVPNLSHYVLRRAGTDGPIVLFTEERESPDPLRVRRAQRAQQSMRSG
jgi:hypothetical protein